MLAAPGLRDDFYLDLVCWSRLDVIAVGLGSRVRLYRASTLKELCDVGIGDAAASLAWSPDGRRLAVGCASGRIALYDVGRGVVVTPANGHRGRVGCLDWRGDVLASGSRDRGVACRDVRVSPRKMVARWRAHRQEVCGLRWSPGGDALATGGDQCIIFSTTAESCSPRHRCDACSMAWRCASRCSIRSARSRFLPRCTRLTD